MKRDFACVIALSLGLSACASGPPFVDQMEPQATAMAVKRAQFDLECPAATGQVLNRQQLEPLLAGGPTRASYTIGVSGCGKQMSLAVICSENNNQCVEGEGRR
jgi:hypothetical protein